MLPIIKLLVIHIPKYAIAKIKVMFLNNLFLSKRSKKKRNNNSDSTKVKRLINHNVDNAFFMRYKQLRSTNKPIVNT